METYIDLKEKINEEKLKIIGKEIKNGKLVIFPTETVYGIGTNGLSSEAVKKVYMAKGRDFKNPINLLVGNIEIVNKHLDLDFVINFPIKNTKKHEIIKKIPILRSFHR